MIPLTDEENKYYENQQRCYICKERFTRDDKKGKIIVILQKTVEELLITSVI